MSAAGDELERDRPVIQKQGVLEAIGKMIFPAGIHDAIHTLSDALPNISIYGFYPSFRWIDRGSRSREDVVLLLSQSALVRCRVITEGFEVVDFGGRDVRQDTRKIETELLPLNAIRHLVLRRTEGPRARHGVASSETTARIDFGDGAPEQVITLPFDHDLLDADHIDRADVTEGVTMFGEALLNRLLEEGSG